jgi:hypothetical protein
MRPAIGLIVAISIGALSPAYAADPQQPSAALQPAQDSTSAPAAPSPADLQAGVKSPVVDSSSTTSSTSAAAKPPVVVKADKPVLTDEEQRLVSKGYKLDMRNGEKWFCRRELELGSRVNAKNVCGTASMLLQSRTDQQKDLRESQKRLIYPTNHP